MSAESNKSTETPASTTATEKPVRSRFSVVTVPDPKMLGVDYPAYQHSPQEGRESNISGVIIQQSPGQPQVRPCVTLPTAGDTY